jgi:hypothetical protein
MRTPSSDVLNRDILLYLPIMMQTMNSKTAESKHKLEEVTPSNENDGVPEKKHRRGNSTEDNSISNDSEILTEQTIMGFPSHPTSTNRELMTRHHSFVEWAHRKEAEGAVCSRLQDFLDWANSPDGKQLEEDCERLTFGVHKGKTFQETADADPGYHTRYAYMLKKDGEKPSGQFARYIKWFKKAKRSGRIHGEERWSRDMQQENGYVSGSEQFNFGCHRGHTFSQVAAEDPSYHLRFTSVNHNLNDIMRRYVRYFNLHGDQTAAREGELDCLAQHAGIIRPDWFDDTF